MNFFLAFEKVSFIEIIKILIRKRQALRITLKKKLSTDQVNEKDLIKI